MADRFPSIEDFDEGETEVRGKPDADGAEGEDDFLARERAVLGDDADQFTGPDDRPAASATVEDGDDDLLGGGDDFPMDATTSSFQSSFPPVETSNDRVAPGGSITGPTHPAPSYQAPEDEPEVIQQWRERRDLALQHRTETAAKKKEETVKAAQQSIDDFYENYNNKKDKSIAQTRREADEFLASREDTSAGGTSWERIAKLVDLSGKGAKGGAAGTGKERFRELLTSLKKDERAPGAAGV